jgi:hypothetical protein
MDKGTVHLFLYTEIVQEKQKVFWISVKWQNFTQEIAAVAALCYNKTKRK